MSKRKREDKDEDGPTLKRLKLDEEITCPVLQEKFVFPVTLFCGHTIEHSSVEKLKDCPICRQVNLVKNIQPNYALMNIIDKIYPDYRKEIIKEKKIKDPRDNELKKVIDGRDALRLIKINGDKMFGDMLNDFSKTLNYSVEKSWISTRCTGNSIKIFEKLGSREMQDRFIQYALKTKHIKFGFTPENDVPISLNFSFVN